jgi:hypothetical protein
MSDTELVEEIYKLLDRSDLVFIHRANMQAEAVLMHKATFDWVIDFIEKNQQDPDLITNFLKNHSHLEPEA